MQLQALNPSATIVMLQLSSSFVTAYDPTSSDPLQTSSLLDPNQYQRYQAYMQAAYATMQSLGVPKLSYFVLPESVGDFPRGCIGHPNPQGNRAAADALTPFIRQLIGW